MKKLGICLLALFLLVGCGTKKEKKEIQTYGNSEDVVIAYRGTPGGENAISKEVNLYTNRTITIGYSNQDGFKAVSLTQEQYDEILKKTFESAFFELTGNIGQEVEGGYEESITLYYDGTTKTTSGAGIENPYFIEVRDTMLKYEN